MQITRLLTGTALAALALVSGCGGGGGSTAAPAPPVTPTPPPPATSGLVPAAGTAGAVLYADAAPLRVLRAGAVWTYHGVDQKRGAASTAAETASYANSVTQSSVAGGLLEKGSNPFNDGPDTSGPVRYESGAYKYIQTLQLAAGGAPQNFDVTELRSPVRVNDQYASIDKHIADSGADFDGDKVNDAVDLALYTRVVGEEVLDLPYRAQVRAVRVDTTMRLRATNSKTGTPGPLYEAVQQTWYVAGIGIVKSRLEEPGADASQPNRVVTEDLQNWDGVSEGFGHLPLNDGTKIVDGFPTSYPMPLAATDAAGFDDHAVVMTPTATLGAINLANLDAHAVLGVQTKYQLAALFPGAGAVAEPHLLRVGAELRLLALTDGAISMVGLDATGEHVTLPARTVVAAPVLVRDPADRQRSYRVAADSSGLWLSWSRRTGNATFPTEALALRRFDAAGQPQGHSSETVTDAPNANLMRPIEQLTVTDNRVLVSWYASIGFGAARRVQVVDMSSGALLADTTLPITADWCSGISMVSLQQGAAMSCLGYVDGVRAARLNDNGSLQLAAGGALPNAKIQAPWLQQPDGNTMVGGAGGDLVVAAHQYGRYWAADTADSHWITVLRTDSSGGVLSQGVPKLLARVPGDMMYASYILPMGNRVMVIGADGGGWLRAVAVWRG